MRRNFVVLFFVFAFLLAVILLLIMAKPGLTGNLVKPQLKEEHFSYKILFCSESDCINEIKILIGNSTNIDCAMYNFRKDLLDAGSIRELRVVTDNNYKENNTFIRKDGEKGLMHNKFCIFDNKTVLTGSFNPSGSMKDRNNMIIIESEILSRNYEEEFEELWNGNFGNGSITKNEGMILGSTLVESYFCPEDICAGKVAGLIDNSNSSILFMVYSFTHKGIANSLILKSMEGKDIRGVIDSSSDKETFSLLKAQGIDVKIDAKKGIMHHKVFIIDNETVITGSFNPTYNADTRNDENIMVIHNRDVAAAYLEEFERVWN